MVEILDFAQHVIAPGSEVHTDGSRLFRRLAEMGYTHHATVAIRTRDKETVLPGLHLVASLLKRLVIGTLHYGMAAVPCPTTSTSSRSGSTVATPAPAACCSTGCCNKRCTPAPSR